LSLTTPSTFSFNLQLIEPSALLSGGKTLSAKMSIWITLVGFGKVNSVFCTTFVLSGFTFELN
ncbi:hypothetical protein, partial [Acinetobacter baumannii]